MEAKATLRYARITPRKARRVVDLIRGKKAAEALIALRFMPYRGSNFVEKILKGKLFHAGVARIEIERMGQKIRVIIHTARPGIIIGKKGAEVEKLRKELETLTG